jgi:drug/metabolite transporter (DMT)-like permease
LIAVAVWYALGIVSISTTKILLVKGTPPLLLTVQQLLIGFTVLRGYMSWKEEEHDGKKNEHPGEDEEYGTTNRASNMAKDTNITTTTYQGSPIQLWHEAPYLVAAGLFFTLGFLATNLGFQASSASFVETIKAAEPLTSAGLAVGFGLESLNVMEWASLATLIVGVLASTLANSQSSAAAITLKESLVSCGIVMASNLCFSLRGLYQKWFLQKQSGSQPRAEELQVQMQQLGVWVLIGPAVVGYGKWGVLHLIQKGVSIQYVGLAVINGLAFTSYK